jgi:CheY-like chemotaxis protein
MNLITNASEAIGGVSGIIHVTTGAQDCGHDYIAECVLGEGKAEGTYVFLEVTDTGMGIERDLLPRIFDPFFTTKFPGRGLGLAAVLGIVRAHRGFIRVTTRPARGTSYRVHQPVAPAAANGEPVRVAPEASGAVTDQAPGTRQTILFVDDDETIRTVARRILTKVGHRVLLASDGREAVHMFTEHADHVDAVVLDLSMPHMSGAETFQEIRKLRPNVPILVSSGYSEQHMSDQFRGIGPAEFLQKPYPAEALVARMDVLLGRKTG